MDSILVGAATIAGVMFVFLVAEVFGDEKDARTRPRPEDLPPADPMVPRPGAGAPSREPGGEECAGFWAVPPRLVPWEDR